MPFSVKRYDLTRKYLCVGNNKVLLITIFLLILFSLLEARFALLSSIIIRGWDAVGNCTNIANS